MPSTQYDVFGNPVETQESQSDEIFTSENMEAINIVAGNIDDVVLVADNGESWATRAEQGAADAEAAAAGIIAIVIVYDLPGGTTGDKTGIGAAWVTAALPTPTDNTLVYARYAGLVCILVSRVNANTDAAWEVVAGIGGGGTIAEPPNNGAAYLRVTGSWVQGVTSVAGRAGAVTLNLDDLTDVFVTAPSAGQALVYDAVAGLFRNLPQTGGIADAPSNGNTYGRLDAGWVTVAPSSHTHPLQSLSDVVGSPLNGQILKWNSSLSKFEYVNEAGASGTLGGLTNVVDGVDSATDGQILVKRAAGWTNEAPAVPGSITDISARVSGPATHLVNSNDIDSVMILDCAGGIINVDFDDSLTSGNDHVVSGLICVENADATKYVQFRAATPTVTTGDPPPIESFEFPGLGRSRDSATSTIATAGDYAPCDVDIPACSAACLVLFAHFMVPNANFQGAGRPTPKWDGTARAWTRLQVWTDDGTTAGPPPMVGMYVLPLGDISASTVKQALLTIGASQFNGIGGVACIVSGVNQSSPVDVQGSSMDNAGTNAAISLALTPSGANRLGLWYAAKRNYGTASPPTGVADPTVSGTGVSLVTPWDPVDAAFGANTASIHNTNCHAALAAANASTGVTATITFPSTQDLSIIGCMLKPADIIGPSMTLRTPNNVAAQLKQPRLMATWVYEGAPNRIVRLGF